MTTSTRSWQKSKGKMDLMRVLPGHSFSELLVWFLRRTSGYATASARLLPDFMIIGAQRCGTTSLYHYLSQHPQVYPAFPKEVHFFSNHFHKGIHWYRSHFPLASQKRRGEIKSNLTCITGEATPYYLNHPLAPQRAAQIVPNARLIVLLRDPVKRAYSHYIHEVQMGVETLRFEEAIKKEKDRLEGEFAKLTNDDQYRSLMYQHFSYLHRGIYIDHIQRWLQYFSPESILYLRSEQMKKDPIASFERVTAFLGLPKWDHIDFKEYHSSAYPPMEPKIKEQLDEYFAPHNKRLLELTGINIETETKN